MVATSELTYMGEEPISFFIIETRRKITVKKGDKIKVNMEEYAEIMRSRIKQNFKEFKGSQYDKEKKPKDGGELDG